MRFPSKSPLIKGLGGWRALKYGREDISMKSPDKLKRLSCACRKNTIRDITRRTQGVNLRAVIEKLNPVIRGMSTTFGRAM